MRKIVSILLLLILALVFLGVSPVRAEGMRSLNLLGISFIRGKGVVFTFKPRGEFKPSELIGEVRIGAQTFPLTCRLNDFGRVKCVADQSLVKYIGQTATGMVAGFPFSGRIRAQIGGSASYCITVWYLNGSSDQVCSDRSPQAGDWVLLPDDSIAYYDPNGPKGPGFYPELYN